MSYELEYNARSLPPADIARSFVPPEPHFVRLLSRNHTLLLGPRGSGKTTLLKMLTVKALQNWAHVRAPELARQIEFNAAFVPADIAWGKQIDALGALDFHTRRKEAAFVIHTLRALVHSMREAVELSRKPPPDHLAHLAISLTSAKEEQFIKLIAVSLGLTPLLDTLLGLELALEAKLDAINVGDLANSFSIESFSSKISLLISAFNSISGHDDKRWALLFDELEIAPTQIKTFLLSGIRSFDERIVVKLAIAPYMEDATFDRSPTSPHPLHDYNPIQLSYPNKDEAAQFSLELFRNTLERLGIQAHSLPSLFGLRSGREAKRSVIPKEFASLVEKDDSFAHYARSRGIFSPAYSFTENRVAQDIRKIVPIVLARDFYIKQFSNGRVVANRSRKSYALYTNYPSIVEVTEGNPRAILTLLGPMAQEHRAAIQHSESPETISSSIQSRAIRRVELLLTSLLQVIPLDLGGFQRGKGMLDFVDQIGRAFEDRLLKQAFSPDYVGSFILDDNISNAVVNAVGKALNAGALIHVPYPDAGPDTLLRGLRGQRFRLSYALSARYRLPLTLGERVNLSTLLFETRGVNVTHDQETFFKGSEHDF